MKPHTKRLSAWMALCVVSSYVVCPTSTRADATGIAGPGSGNIANNTTNVILHPIPVIGSIKQVGGTVERRDPIDGDKLGPVMTCKQGDQLVEGSIVSTGAKSFAHLFWSGTETRIWQDTIIRILPCAKTVCLLNGALMFHKSKQCKDNECIVETKRLQARIRGTHVRVHAGDNVDTILVLEAGRQPVEVYNKMNGSRVSLTPGVELEVRGQINSADPRFILKSENFKPQNFPMTKLNPNKGELIFQDKHSTTVAFTANSKAVLEDPLLVGDANTPALESLGEIRDAMAKVPTSDNFFGNLLDNTFNAGKPDKLIAKALKILCVPTKVAYYIGPNIGSDKTINLPSLAYSDLSPAGVMTAVNSSPTRQMASVRVAPVAMPMMMHNNDNPAINPALQLTSNVQPMSLQQMVPVQTTVLPVPVQTMQPMPTAFTPVVPVRPFAPMMQQQAPLVPVPFQPGGSNIGTNLGNGTVIQQALSKTDTGKLNIGHN